MELKGSTEKARLLVDSILIDKEVANVIRKLRNHSEETYEHSLNVAYLTAEILYDRCCAEYELEEVTKGALLHDIGKIKVESHILHYHLCISDSYREVIKTHPGMGIRLLEKYFEDGLSHIVEDIVLMHHERIDGSGYPNGISKLPWYVELVGTVDAYDAMTAKRSYGRERSAKEAIEVLKNEAFPEVYVDDIERLKIK